jgi:hypothetical protein
MDLKETNFTGKLLKVFPGPVTTAIVGDDNLNIPGGHFSCLLDDLW